MQKSAYVTQVRLSSYTPDFGTNPVLDSAVMLIKPSYSADSITFITRKIIFILKVQLLQKV